MQDAIHGARGFVRGFALLAQPRVRRWAVAPIALSALLYAALLWLLGAYFEGLVDWLRAQVPDWLAWLDAMLWVLFAGLMLTPQGPRTLEFNCRFGDPETQAILPILEDDLLELALACAERRLAAHEPRAKKESCVGITLASKGYPNRPQTGRPIEGLDRLPPGAFVFHAGTRRDGLRWLTTGGRVLTVCATGVTVAEARVKAYAAADLIKFDGMQRRGDIAAKELVAA